MVNLYEKSIEVNRKLVAVLDTLLTSGNWEASLFLKATAKQIQQLREKAEQLLITATGSGALIRAKELTEKDGYRKVFISVYQAEGTNLQQWNHTLKSLMEYSISRPVYGNEETVKALIRSKTDKQKEGYVVVYIQEENIIRMPGKEASDRLGNELLTLKTGAVKLENIIEFVHCNQSYELQEKGLVLKNGT